ncbi:MAG: DUF4394 domain-containing protein [Solirubrobacterales bacterium]|nr:DUF4394 domain-containing protein [Solirubrobacterales bacterium]
MPRLRLLAAAAALVSPALPASTASAERFVAVDAQNRLYAFDDSKPGDWKRSALRGLAAGERIVGIDVRPANRQLVAVTNQSRLYTVSRSKRKVTAIGAAALMPALAGSSFGFDFNPTVDRIRLVSGGGQNLRLQPDTGVVAATDQPLVYKAGDGGAGVPPAVLGSAYTNSVRAAMTTTLYGIDSARDTLVIQAPPNDGVLSTVGALGVNLAGPLGFDISARDGGAYVLARRAGLPRSRLFRLDLMTGRATQVGVVSRAPSLVALAALSAPKAR